MASLIPVITPTIQYQDSSGWLCCFEFFAQLFQSLSRSIEQLIIFICKKYSAENSSSSSFSSLHSISLFSPLPPLNSLSPLPSLHVTHSTSPIYFLFYLLIRLHHSLLLL